jgi:hypothetical protein
LTTSEGNTAAPAAGLQRYKPLVGAAPAVAVILIALAEIVCVARAGRDVPGDDAWQRASAAVRAERQAGELIVFAPAWNDPVGRMHLGDLIPIEMAARMDAAGYAAIWELSIRGARAPETRGLSSVYSQTFDGVRVRKYEQQPVEVVTDFLTAKKKGGGAPRLEEVGFEPHRCIKVVPRPDQTITVTYPEVALGSKLVGYVGLADVFKRRDVRDPGRLAVKVGDAEVASVQFGVDDGWVRFEADTTPAENVAVTFEATAVGPNARDRLICFAAEARR